MAETITRTLPSQFIEDLGRDYGTQLAALTSLPVDTTKFAPQVAAQDARAGRHERPPRDVKGQEGLPPVQVRQKRSHVRRKDPQFRHHARRLWLQARDRRQRGHDSGQDRAHVRGLLMSTGITCTAVPGFWEVGCGAEGTLVL